jgi:hypothetical protein
VAVRLALDCGSLGDQPQSLRCRTMDGEDTSRPAPVAAGEESDARLPRQSPGACFLTQDASPVRAARLPCDGSGDAPAPRGRRRPPSSAERWKANDDRGVSLGRLHEEGDADSSEANARARTAVRVCAKANITGVAFFDFKYGQTGVAPNAIELHPILAFACVSLPPPPPTTTVVPPTTTAPKTTTAPPPATTTTTTATTTTANCAPSTRTFVSRRRRLISTVGIFRTGTSE